MSDQQTSVPTVEDYLDPLAVPVLKPDAMKDLHSFEASEDHQAKLGFPGGLVDDWHDVAIDKMGDLLTLSSVNSGSGNGGAIRGGRLTTSHSAAR